MFPNAINALECMTGHGLDSTLPTWLTFWLCIVVCTQYARISLRWWSAFSHSRIACSLIAIFILCALCGYGSFCLSLKEPNLAYTARLIGLFVLSVSNEAFLLLSSRKHFLVESEDQRLGASIRMATNNETHRIEILKELAHLNDIDALKKIAQDLKRDI